METMNDLKNKLEINSHSLEKKIISNFQLVNIYSKSLRPILVRYFPNESNTQEKMTNQLLCKYDLSSSIIGELSHIPNLSTNPILLSFLLNNRWKWIVENSNTRDLVLLLIIKSRIKNHWKLLNINGLFHFIKVIK